MGSRDLPYMYAQAQRRAASESKCGHIRQIPTTHVCNTFSKLNSAEPDTHCATSLCNDGSCVWLWVFNSNVKFL